MDRAHRCLSGRFAACRLWRHVCCRRLGLRRRPALVARHLLHREQQGTYCANSHNAWGWTASGGGFRSFGSWEEGITAHVRYLKNMYGTTLTVAAAKRYCPPTWQDWYNKVGSEMNRI